MSSQEYKRRRKEAKSKFRKLWKARTELLNGNNEKNEEETNLKQTTSKDSNDLSTLDGNTQIKKVHIPKTKYAIAFGFIGTSYHGYQKQVEYKTGIMDKVKTVEGTLENCLCQIGAIDESFRNMTHKLQMSKSSRTDKGVHAACTYIGGRFNINFNEDENLETEPVDGQISDSSMNHEHLETNLKNSEKTHNCNVVNDESIGTDSSKEDRVNEVKAPIHEISKEEIFVKRLNSALPEDIRCYKIQRVTKGFDARLMCSKRKYEYLFPEWLLCRSMELPNEEHVSYFKKLEKYIEENINNHEKVRGSKSNELLYEVKGKFIEVEPNIERFNEIIKKYEGTHDFHNFTVRQKLETNNTQRYIEKITVEYEQIDEMKVVKISIIGQSFLYNQIRKMICLALQQYLNVAPKNIIKYTLRKSRTFNINTVPSEGLILHHPSFDTYNITRCSMANLQYIEYDDIKDEVEEFKRECIYPEIKRSIECKIWEGWMETVNTYPFYLENQIVPNGESVS